MRFAGVVVTILTAGCTSTRGGGSADVEGPGVVVRESVPPSSVAPSGPMDARALGQELGLDVQDGGASVLLRSDNFLARVFPGSDRLTLNGRVVSMTESSRRDGSSVVVPASGVAAIRRGFAAAKVAPPVLAPAAPYRPAPVRFPGATAVPSLAKGGGTAGDAGWVPLAGQETRPWKWIVVHHSDDVSGCCAKYDAAHRAKGWDECGYHFVIGNGTMTGDGQVEVTTRWPVQKHGAHAKTPDNRYNDFGIGVVLVGDFEKGPAPSTTQYGALLRLTRWLMARYDISSDRVVRHSDAKATACPGQNFPWARFQNDLVAITAAVGGAGDGRHASTAAPAGPAAASASASLAARVAPDDVTRAARSPRGRRGRRRGSSRRA